MNKEIMIVCHYAQEPPWNTMLRYHNWGKELVKRGYSVSIVCASTLHNTNIDMIEKTGKEKSVCDQIKYYYIKTPAYSNNGIRRMVNMLAFCLKLFKVRKIKPFVIVSCEAYVYPFVRLYFCSVPVVTDTVDLWPQSIIEYSGYSTNNLMIRLLYGVEKYTYLRSNALIFSMEGGEDYLKEQTYSDKIDYKKVFHINMGSDIEYYDKCMRENPANLPWRTGHYHVVYCGSVRIANNVLDICKAALELKNRGIDDVDIHIYGNGDQLDSLKEFSKENRLDNIFFYGRIQKKDIPGVLSKADANILTYKQVNLMKYGGSQSKLFDYLTCGRPIICTAKFGYNLIERYSCGVVTEDQTPKSIANAIVHLKNLNRNEIDQMCKNARSASLAYSQDKLVDKLCEVFQFVTNKGVIDNA